MVEVFGNEGLRTDETARDGRDLDAVRLRSLTAQIYLVPGFHIKRLRGRLRDDDAAVAERNRLRMAAAVHPAKD